MKEFVITCNGEKDKDGNYKVEHYEELIRCESCKYYNEGQNEVDSWMRCRLHNIDTSPDEFCSWAQK